MTARDFDPLEEANRQAAEASDLPEWFDHEPPVEANVRPIRKNNPALVAMAIKESGGKVTDDGGLTSEDAIATAFEMDAADWARFCHTNGKWYVWDHSRWAQDPKRRVQHAMRLIAKQAKDPKLRKASTINGAVSMAAAHPALAIQLAEFDTDKFLLGTPGGTVDLRTGSLRESRKEEHITRLTSVAPAPAGTVALRWQAFLNEATRGDADLIRFLQQIVGYTLTGDTREHALFFVYGDGGNGKGVFLNVVAKLLGDYARTAAMDTFTDSKFDKHPTDLAMLAGARLVSASETEDSRAWAEARIKQMTGGDPISARFMRQDFFEYLPEFKLLIIGNHKPRLNNVDAAVKRRFNIIPFVHKPATVDRDLETKLHGEWPAILRWAIDGCLDWQANGLVRPQVVLDATDEYFEDQDLFRQWLDECCQTGPSFREPDGPLFASWKRYATAASEDIGTSKSFKDSMRKAGFEHKKSGSFRGFAGVRVNPQSAPTEGQFAKDWE